MLGKDDIRGGILVLATTPCTHCSDIANNNRSKEEGFQWLVYCILMATTDGICCAKYKFAVQLAWEKERRVMNASYMYCKFALIARRGGWLKIRRRMLMITR